MRPPGYRQSRNRHYTLLWTAAAVVAAAVLATIVYVLHSPGGHDRTVEPQAACNPSDTACEPEGQGGGPLRAAPPPNVAALAAAVVEGSCGQLVYGKNQDLRLPPASTTKIATAIVAAQRIDDLDEVVTTHVNSGLLVASTESTVMGLQPGDRLSLRDLLYGMLLQSGNDAAIALADAVAGSETGFIELMNEEAAALGLQNTHFSNPHGLDDRGLYSSPYDLAQLGRALLAQPVLAQIVRTREYQPDWDGPELHNGNELLDYYPGAIGVKIGFTEKARQTIVAAAERAGRRLIVSVMGSPDRYKDAVALFNWAFANTEAAC